LRLADRLLMLTLASLPSRERGRRTSENFLALCTGSKGYGYKTSAIHRCVPKFCVHGGDFTHRDGTGGRSIYGLSFADESFELRHNGPGVVSMANKGPNSNNSQFFISLTAAPWLDGVHVAFGLVVEGFSVVKKIEAVGTFSGEPTSQVVITGCGANVPPPPRASALGAADELSMTKDLDLGLGATVAGAFPEH